MGSFKEFDQEAEAKDEEEKKAAEKGSSELLFSPPPKEEEEEKGEEIEKRFVELDRVDGYSRNPIERVRKDHSPREIGWVTGDLLVHKIPDPDTTGGKRGGNHQDIEKGEKGDFWILLPVPEEEDEKPC